MNVRIVSSCLLLLLLGVSSILSAQNHSDITFDAQANKSKMLLNSTIEYTVNLRNSRGENFEPPNFPGFTILSGPGRTMGSRTINGATTTYQSYSWLLQPQRIGKLTISPASIRAGGRTYRSNSLEIEVLPVDSKLAAAAPDNFMRLELSQDTAYVGEQLIMDLVLYTSDNAISRNLVAEPGLSGFFSYPRRQFDGRTKSVLENGKEYLARTIASTALYPLKSGVLKVDPYRLLLGLVRYQNPQSTFSRRYNERVPLQTDTTYLVVNELPAPRPTNFSGGVGNFSMEVSADRMSLSTDDAITLRLDIRGKGDVKRITAPEPVSPKDWVIYDPEVLKEEFYDSPSGIYGQKILEYKIVPKRVGKQQLVPILNYFNPDSNRYIGLESVSYDIDVTQGSAVVNYEETVDDTLTETLSLLDAAPVGALSRHRGNGVGMRLALPIFLLPLLLFGGYFLYDRKKKAAAAIDPAEKAKNRAKKIAQTELKTAKIALESRDVKQVFNAIEDALLGYLRNKLQLPVRSLTKRNIHEVLIDKGSSTAIADQYVELLKNCELALYANTANMEGAQLAFQQAEKLIVKTEEEISM